MAQEVLDQININAGAVAPNGLWLQDTPTEQITDMVLENWSPILASGENGEPRRFVAPRTLQLLGEGATFDSLGHRWEASVNEQGEPTFGLTLLDNRGEIYKPLPGESRSRASVIVTPIEWQVTSPKNLVRVMDHSYSASPLSRDQVVQGIFKPYEGLHNDGQNWVINQGRSEILEPLALFAHVGRYYRILQSLQLDLESGKR